MNAGDLISALSLPPEALVDRRVPKRLLIDKAAPTSADRRLIQEALEELTWIAALKPASAGIPAFEDAQCEYSEIAVLAAMLRATRRLARLIELIHRAIPYPVLLVFESGSNSTGLSLARKRRAENEAGKVVLDGPPVTIVVEPVDAAATQNSALFHAWLGMLALSAQPRADLRTLYEAWIARAEALQVARITGRLGDAASPGARRAALDDYGRLQRDIINIRAKAAKEKQMNRRVELNLELKRLESQLAVAAAALN